MRSELDRLYEAYERDRIRYGYGVAEHNYRDKIDKARFKENYGYDPTSAFGELISVTKDITSIAKDIGSIFVGWFF